MLQLDTWVFDVAGEPTLDRTDGITSLFHPIVRIARYLAFFTTLAASEDSFNPDHVQALSEMTRKLADVAMSNIMWMWLAGCARVIAGDVTSEDLKAPMELATAVPRLAFVWSRYIIDVCQSSLEHVSALPSSS